MLHAMVDYAMAQIEKKGWAIKRRGDALVGCDEYEGADFNVRLSGALGWHDDTCTAGKAKTRAGLVAGDILAVSRGLYKHYGVYTGQDKLIHYTSEESDLQGTIEETSMSRFLRGKKRYYVMVFPETYGEPGKEIFDAANAAHGVARLPRLYQVLLHIKNSRAYHLYTPEETVSRAYSRLHEERYHLLFNNCEHFALWCKTGVSTSHQVNALIDVLLPCCVNVSG